MRGWVIMDAIVAAGAVASLLSTKPPSVGGLIICAAVAVLLTLTAVSAAIRGRH
jgi:hypothetical protein